MFVCSQCGYQSIKWLGKCPVCESWESFAEEKRVSPAKRAAAPRSSLTTLGEVGSRKLDRISTGICELDNVLGGGLVKGEVVLLGGEPGVGKSTLLLEVSAFLSRQGKVLYVSAEESIEQVALRAQRLNIPESGFFLLNEDNLAEVYSHLQAEHFDYLIIDSIQVVSHPELESQKGSVSQIKGCADFLTQIAKSTGTVVFIVGHVTKEGAIAGPKLLEHIVDCVLYFESEVISSFRIIRSIKNRFGPAGELGAFEMTSQGLRELKSLSDLFFPHKTQPVAGSSVVCVVEGIRPIIVELQSLTSSSYFGVVRRRSLGFDFNRFSLLVAIIETNLKLSLAGEDVFLSVSGGFRINDPSADLGACMAIVSSFRDTTIPAGSVFLGEVGLAGEVRPISAIHARLKEIKRAGFKKVFLPRANLKEVGHGFKGLEVEPVDFLKEAVTRTW